MKGKIGIYDHHVQCIIGDLKHERTELQSIFVDVEVEIDFSQSAISDNLKDTFCYTRLAEICTELAYQQYRLLETYAAAVVRRLVDEPGILSVFIRIKKPSAISSAQYAYIELRSP